MKTNNKFSFEFFDCLPEMYFMVGKDGIILQKNKKAAKLLSSKKSEGVNNFFDLIELCDRNLAEKSFSESIKNNSQNTLITRFYIDRKFFDVKVIFTPPTSLNGKEKQVLIVANDITEAKAKEVRGLVDRIITWGKRGDLHARRLTARRVRSRTVVKKVFDELAPRYRDRPGGYTRIMKVGFRHGDNAPVVIMELVDHPAPEA